MLPLLVTVSPASLVFTKIPAIPLCVPLVVDGVAAFDSAISYAKSTPAESALLVNLISKSFEAVVTCVFLPPNTIANPFLLLAPL